MSDNDPFTDTSRYARLRVLSERVWEGRVSVPDIEVWLSNFEGLTAPQESERTNALHLLSHFNHFGLREIRVLLMALYRDLFRYPIIQRLRLENDRTLDSELISSLFAHELAGTRFLGMGNPSESGAHLLYYFRQENSLHKNLFVYQHEVFDRAASDPAAKIGLEGLKRLVFIDDVLGSGKQAIDYSKKVLPSIRDAADRSGVDIEILYFVLFAKPAGLEVARSQDSLFDDVRAVQLLDPSECAFTENSRVYAKPPNGVSLALGRELAEAYGTRLFPDHPLGYREGQLLLGLHHNVPNNTLPIFWHESRDLDWKPAFKRHSKES